MRKAIIEIKLNATIRNMLAYYLDKVESIELLELIKVDFEEGTKLALSAITLKEGHSIEEFKHPEYVEMLTVLRQEGRKYICLAKARFMRKFTQSYNIDYDEISQKFNMDIVWDTPTMFTQDRMVCSVMGTDKNLQRFIESMRAFGEITNISFKKATYSEHAVLSCLTQRQKEVLIAAKKNGYYLYPRGITSQQLSQKIGLSKPTVVQHLRKAESRLMATILAGY